MMTSDDIKLALTKRWPDDRYLSVYEAPLDSSRLGTKIDVLVMALWWSDHHELDTVEIKVSYGDWKKEIVRRDWVCVRQDGTESVYGTRDGAKARQRAGDAVMVRYTSTTAKSLLWRRKSHRFWIACPEPLAAKILPELPEGWGLIAVTVDGGTRAVRKADKQKPEPLTAIQWLGLMRASADSGRAALLRAKTKGYDDGYKDGVEGTPKQWITL